MADETQNLLTELVSFLNSDRADVKEVALEHIVGFTSTDDGRKILKQLDVVTPICKLVGDRKNIAKLAATSLINLSADSELTDSIIERNIFGVLVDGIKDSRTPPEVVELFAMLLINLTISEPGCHKLLQKGTNMLGLQVSKLVDAYVFLDRGEKDPYAYIGNVLQNITQVSEGRIFMLTKEKNVLPLLLPFIKDKSAERRKCVLGIVKNCCFELEDYSWILTETNLISDILYVLRGPEVFTKEDMQGMHASLHAPRREREHDHEMKSLVLQSLLLMCRHREYRLLLDKMQAYVVLREYEKYEKDRELNEYVHRLVEHIMLQDYQPSNQGITVSHEMLTAVPTEEEAPEPRVVTIDEEIEEI